MYSLDIAYTFASAWTNNDGGVETLGFEWWISGKPVDEKSNFFFHRTFDAYIKQDGLCLSIKQKRDDVGGDAITILDTAKTPIPIRIGYIFPIRTIKKTELIKTGIAYDDTQKLWKIDDATSLYNSCILCDFTYFSLSIPEPSTYASIFGILAFGLVV